MGHYSFKEREPAWGDVDKSALPMEAFAFPHALVLAGRMTRKDAMEMPKSDMKLPHHWVDSDGEMWAHRDGCRLGMQAMMSGIRGQRVHLPSNSRATVRAHLERHNRVRERSRDMAKDFPRENLKKSTLESVIALLQEDPVPVVMVETFLKGQFSQMEALLLTKGELETSVDEAVQSIELLESELVIKSESLAELTVARDKLAHDAEDMMTQLRETSASRDALQVEVNQLSNTNGNLQQAVESLRRTILDLEAQLVARRQKQVDAILGRMEVCSHDEVRRERFRQRLPQLDFEALDVEWESISDEFNRLFLVMPVTTRDESRGVSAQSFSSYRVRRE